MAERPIPPEDITPDDFYLKWIPEQAAANDPEQQAKLKGFSAVIQFIVTGDEGGEYVLDIEDGKVTTRKEKSDAAKLTVSMALADWREINSGRLNPQMAFMSGKLKVSGDMSLAMKLGTIMGT